MDMRDFLRAEIAVSTESAVLLTAGIISLTASALLFPISKGTLPYYENGLLGLLMFVMAVQIITLGKAPFGDVGRGPLWTVLGVVLAGIGVVTCFIPGLFRVVPRLVLLVSMGVGGAAMFVRLCLDVRRLATWLRLGGVFVHLAAACGAAYLLSMSIGLSLWSRELLSAQQYSVLLMAYGASLVYLAFVLVPVYRDHPPARTGNLSPDKSMILLVGVFMVLLGVLLIPVSLGLLPFSAGAQLGLLMVIFAVQMLAFGNTPVGSFSRTPAVILVGLLFTVLGTASCMVPELLVPFLTVAVGILNVFGGAIGMFKLWSIRGRGPDFAILKRLGRVQVAVNMFSILFGASMLISRLLPGTVIGIILSLNGVTLLYLLHLLVEIEKMSGDRRSS
ncbi:MULTISPECIES: hypothetical protein [Dethiosulfovibrio]|uniref:Polysaccharide biosynthesis protein C-terminal domain-containing protein n=2 Tax=Dethiosulfovibrio TaxID=47054 RepID=A0ABS9EQ50_9BACT|nr:MULTISPECIES: hypothetical protein [Dethiosulfovibrio]MCF4114324.1 hypothetical protein [Dethiosulfovibrio russensis]MCF4143316.1 hypothetical protein [Dethiosulfovibrio marinus]MCF4145485.1 hypothetical protein [Dethiosulfovibrio acidaminovorans]